jgi:hypothetical protein
MSEATNYPPGSTTPAVGSSQALEQMARDFGAQIRIGLFVLAFLFAIYPVYYFAKHGVGSPSATPAKTDEKAKQAPVPTPPVADETPVAIPLHVQWLTVLALVALAVAQVNLFYNPPKVSPGEKLRLVLVLLGGLLGICTAAYGFLLPFTEYSSVFGGGFAEWRKNPNAIFRTVLPFFGGLMVAFVSLLLTSGLERTSATARRVLYGYNAVLSGVLLLFICLLLNVMPYSGVWPFKALTKTADWTSTGLYSLSQATKERLATLNEPVKVYVLLPAIDQLGAEVETLMNNLREQTNQITWESLSPQGNYRKVEELANKYQLTDPMGLLVVYGKEGQTSHEFIPRKDLYEDTSTQDSVRFAFKGEAAFTKALTYLSEGKTKSVVYFTQGSGELDFNDHSATRPDVGMGEVTGRLGKGNFEVKPLPFDVAKPKVPEDADIVVVARPRTEMSAAAVSALRTFAAGEGKKRGKLIILLDVVPMRDGKMAKTGLEPLLAEYGVQAGDERLLAVAHKNPLELIAVTNPQGSNPIAKAFYPPGGFAPTVFLLSDVRTVTPVPSNPNAPPKYAPEILLLVPPRRQLIYAQADLNADSDVVANQLRELFKQDQDKFFDKLLPQAPSVAVVVSESKNAPPPIPGHDFMKPGESKPLMVVFGDATWISNTAMAARNGADNYDLFVSCVNWLRERPDIGVQAVADKTRAEYRLPPEISATRLLIMPVMLILVTVICLGTGVWIVRRR